MTWAPFETRVENRILMIQIPFQIFVGPDVFADGDPDFCSQEFDRLLIRSRIEISSLIEHIVSRQQRFEYFPNRPLFRQHRAGIDEWFACFRWD